MPGPAARPSPARDPEQAEGPVSPVRRGNATARFLAAQSAQQDTAEAVRRAINLHDLADPRTLNHLIAVSAKALDAAYGYGVNEPHTFDFYANRGSVREAALLILTGHTDIEFLAEAVHEGWALTVETFEDSAYKDDAAKRQHRYELANTPYAELSDDEKEKDRVVVRALLAVYRQGGQGGQGD